MVCVIRERRPRKRWVRQRRRHIDLAALGLTPICFHTRLSRNRVHGPGRRLRIGVGLLLLLLLLGLVVYVLRCGIGEEDGACGGHIARGHVVRILYANQLLRGLVMHHKVAEQLNAL